jgi:hypothetical protein
MTFGTDNFAQVRRMFAEQFEPDGRNYLYRKFTKAAPIPVSAAERDRYIAGFDTFLRRASWGMTAGIVILIAATVAFVMSTGRDVIESATLIGLGAILAVFLALYWWFWNQPARELRDRAAAGEARSRAEVRRRYLAKTTYGQLALTAAIAFLLLLKAAFSGAPFSGWNLFFLCWGVIVLPLAVVQAFRKWRLGTRTP